MVPFLAHPVCVGIEGIACARRVIPPRNSTVLRQWGTCPSAPSTGDMNAGFCSVLRLPTDHHHAKITTGGALAEAGLRPDGAIPIGRTCAAA